MGGREHRFDRDGRGQFVVLSAGVVAVALAAVLLAYLQLGVHPGVAASADRDRPIENARRLLRVGVHEAVDDVGGEYDWNERAAAVTAVRDDLDGTRETLADAHVEQGVVYRTSYDQADAREWAREKCPSGPGRRFGDCEADRGVVVQERAGQATVVAVALTVTATTPRGRAVVTLVVRPRER